MMEIQNANFPQGTQMPQKPQAPPAEHPVIDAARRGGADVDKLMGAKDLNGLIAAALKGNPQLGTDQGVMLIDQFSQVFKKQFNLTGLELPGAPPPGHMPGAQFGPGGRPMPLQRLPDYGGGMQGILGHDDETSLRQMPPIGGVLGGGR